VTVQPCEECHLILDGLQRHGSELTAHRRLRRTGGQREDVFFPRIVHHKSVHGIEGRQVKLRRRNLSIDTALQLWILRAELFRAAKDGAQEEMARGYLRLDVDKELERTLRIHLLLHIQDDVSDAELDVLVIGGKKNVFRRDPLKRGAGV